MNGVIKKGMTKEEAIEEEVSGEINFDTYQEEAGKTAIYPCVTIIDDDGKHNEANYVYPALGLVNEAGEVAGKIKKIIRDHKGIYKDKETGEIYEMAKDMVTKELGCVLWYMAELASAFEIRLSDVAEQNLEKLASRKRRGKLGGSGDDR